MELIVIVTERHKRTVGKSREAPAGGLFLLSLSDNTYVRASGSLCSTHQHQNLPILLLLSGFCLSPGWCALLTVLIGANSGRKELRVRKKN